MRAIIVLVLLMFSFTTSYAQTPPPTVLTAVWASPTTVQVSWSWASPDSYLLYAKHGDSVFCFIPEKTGEFGTIQLGPGQDACRIPLTGGVLSLRNISGEQARVLIPEYARPYRQYAPFIARP